MNWLVLKRENGSFRYGTERKLLKYGNIAEKMTKVQKFSLSF